MAEWLAEQTAALDRLKEGLRRERFWRPLIADEGSDMGGWRYAPLGEIGEIIDGFVVRARRQVHAGEYEYAIEDVLALKRLAFHLADTPTLIEQKVGYEATTAAQDIVIAMIERNVMTVDYVRRLIRAHERLPNRILVHRSMDITLRFHRLNRLQRFPEQFVPDGREHLTRHLDRNEAMRQINGFYDTVVAALKVETHPERRQALAAIAVEQERRRERLARMKRRPSWWARTWHGYYPHDVVADVTIVSEQGLENIGDLLSHAQARHVLYRTVLAITAYRLEHGEYPASPDDLVPEWMDAVPADLFDEAEQPVRYAVEDDRVMVYSVGPNGEDNGGVDDRDEGDLVIQWRR